MIMMMIIIGTISISIISTIGIGIIVVEDSGRCLLSIQTGELHKLL